VDFLHPTCPICGAELTRTVTGDLATWTCPAGHGAGLTVTEAYHHLQDDEIHRAWDAAKTAPAGPHKCPICARPMVVVTLSYGPDELADGAAGKAAPTGQETIDICTEDELIWLAPGELDGLPTDLPNPEPSAEELAQIDAIRQAFGQSLLDDAHQEDAATLTGRMTRHLSSHPFVGQVARRHWL
jgi:Zn-finger nucleic acid-binding protein